MKFLYRLRALELRYEKLLLLFIVVFIAAIMASPVYRPLLMDMIAGAGSWGYAGVLFIGAASSWGILAAPAFAALYVMGGVLNPLALAAIAAVGATVTDLFIFYIVKAELASIVVAKKRVHPKLSKWLHRLSPLIVGLVVATPLPDEIAAGFLAALRWDERRFIVLIYIAHFLGFLLFAGLGAVTA